jgi:hypothetical protein
MSKIRHSVSGKKGILNNSIFNKKLVIYIPSAPSFTLSSSNETRIVNTVATGFTIISTGDPIDSFSINATPAGMNFNTATGALTGTPSNIQSATSYTISATNAGGTTTRTFTLAITSAGTQITDFSAIGGTMNVGSQFQLIKSSTPSWAGLITGTVASPQTVTVSGVTGVNAAAANGTQRISYDGYNYFFRDINFAGGLFQSLSLRLPGMVITVY